MNHRVLHKKQKKFFLITEILFSLIFIILMGFNPTSEKNEKGRLRISFKNTINGQPLVLRDSMYTTPLGEKYAVTKLRYYISNISLAGNLPLEDVNNYQLIDANKSTSFTIPVKEGKYNKIKFLLGVDSIRNCSGAQEGVLDPMNDMFWTWNTGYVMFKLEGTSPSSEAPNNRIEHHVGGYRFGNNVAASVELNFKEIKIKENEEAEIIIEMDLDKYWSANNIIKIAESPVCTLPGVLAKKIAGNFPKLFSIKNN
ncbi:MAG: MbnP family protein [Ferruginibacter sp.]